MAGLEPRHHGDGGVLPQGGAGGLQRWQALKSCHIGVSSHPLVWLLQKPVENHDDSRRLLNYVGICFAFEEESSNFVAKNIHSYEDISNRLRRTTRPKH